MARPSESHCWAATAWPVPHWAENDRRLCLLAAVGGHDHDVRGAPNGQSSTGQAGTRPVPKRLGQPVSSPRQPASQGQQPAGQAKALPLLRHSKHGMPDLRLFLKIVARDPKLFPVFQPLLHACVAWALDDQAPRQGGWNIDHLD